MVHGGPWEVLDLSSEPRDGVAGGESEGRSRVRVSREFAFTHLTPGRISSAVFRGLRGSSRAFVWLR